MSTCILSTLIATLLPALRVCVFNTHVYAVSDFVKLNSSGVCQDAFMKLFIKKLTLYKPRDDSKLVRMNVWFSSELKIFWGKFVLPTDWSPIAPPHRVIVPDVALDEVVFEVTFPSNVFPYLMTKIGVNPNMRSLMHILSGLVLPDSIGSNLGSIATCRLPMHGDSSVLPAGPTKWKALNRSGGTIADFRISIVDERRELLPYKGGNFSIVIRIRPKK